MEDRLSGGFRMWAQTADALHAHSVAAIEQEEERMLAVEEGRAGGVTYLKMREVLHGPFSRPEGDEMRESKCSNARGTVSQSLGRSS
jgi:hypothetical protein